MRKFSPDSIHPNSVVNNPCQFFFWSINSPNVPYSRYMLIYTYIISIIIICLYVHVHIYHITVYILYSIHKIYDIYIYVYTKYMIYIYICISNIYDIWYNIYIYINPQLSIIEILRFRHWTSCQHHHDLRLRHPWGQVWQKQRMNLALYTWWRIIFRNVVNSNEGCWLYVSGTKLPWSSHL